MKRKIKSAIWNSIQVISTKIKNQYLWESVLNLALRRMNFGNGGDFVKSGELFACKYIENALKHEPKITIFDVGANIGKYSKALSQLFGNQATIYSFEPSKKTFNLFLETTKGCSNIIPNNIGLSDKSYNQTLFTNSDGSGLASVYQRNLEHFGIQMDQTEEITLNSLDIFCYEHKIDRIHFLKLDIEGHELDALKGAKQMLEDKKIDFIQFEFGGCNIDARNYFQDFYYLLKDNYKIYRILEDGLFEIPAYKETYEIFLTINYLAIKR